MNLYPAIDLMDGKAVRLRQGKRDQVTVFGDPVDMAKQWRDLGAQWLHVVDLDAAFDGSTKALSLLEKTGGSFQWPCGAGRRTEKCGRHPYPHGGRDPGLHSGECSLRTARNCRRGLQAMAEADCRRDRCEKWNGGRSWMG